MTHNKENGQKSKNGISFEKRFAEATGLSKVLKKDKPFFVNCHGEQQYIDFDFRFESGGVDYFFDATTTYRSDRLKQKAYNALVYKTNFEKPCKFFMVVERMIENGKKKNPRLIHGIDGVLSFEEAKQMIAEEM